MSDDTLIALAEQHRHPISVSLYNGMIDTGVLTVDDRVELIEGVIVAMSPQSHAHVRAVTELARILYRALSDAWVVRQQAPLTLARSQPEPDVAVVRRDVHEGARPHPSTATLVVEVARSSLALDRAKSAVYAEAKVAEYWIIDVERRCVEVHRDGDGAQYRTRLIVDEGAELSPVGLPDVSVMVAALFEPLRH